VKVPRIPRREVIFLTPAEVETFVAAIPIYATMRRMDLKWLGFRAIVEVLLGTGMRISEALSLTRSSVNLETGEARIVGKGNKERTVFFSPRALGWLKEYLSRRTDQKDNLFAFPNGEPFKISSIEAWCRDTRQRAGLQKLVRPHILRHTVATTLLFNGCPISHVKEILGHDRLETTCQYYLGIDKTAAKAAHRKYLSFDATPGSEESK
jgi:integrase/recombinase XerD